MSQSACFSNYFTNLSDIGNSQANMPIISKIGGIGMTVYRPMIPLYGYIADGATSGRKPDVVANQIAFAALFVGLGKGFYDASVNAATGAATTASSINPSTYDQYLYKRLNADPVNLARYLNAFQLVKNFWVAANPAWTTAELQDAIIRLTNQMLAVADKLNYAPPNIYTFDTGSDAEVAWQLWKAANPGFLGVVGIEIVSIG